MTIATTRGTESTIDALVTDAYHQAGLVSVELTPSEAQKAYARRTLDRVLDELMTAGVQARSVVFSDHTLTSGTYKYAMASDVVDVLGEIMYLDASQTDLTKANGETVMKKITRAEWNQLSDKSATGRPSLYYVHRGADPAEVWLWPIPDEAGTIRVQEHRMPADTTVGSTTLDLLPYWYDYIVLEIGHRMALASSLPATRVQYLGNLARDARNRARSKSKQGVTGGFRFNHPTAWRSM